MKRYLAFSYQSYEAAGGWFDFEGAFDSEEEAKSCVEQAPRDSGHVVDMETGRCVSYRGGGKRWREENQ